MSDARRLAALFLLFTSATLALAAESFELRMVKAGADPGDPALYEHLEHSRNSGFNAVWVYGHAAGAWTPKAAPDGPRLHPEFLALARWCRERDLKLVVSVNPYAESGGRIVFTDREYARRIRRFFRKLRRQAGVHDFVVSFDDQPTKLTDLGDIVEFGRSAAPAHLDLLRRVESRLSKRDRLWFCAAVYSDVHLGDGTGPYTTAFLEGLPEIAPRVGIVWTGPSPVPATIRREDLAAARRRLGGRRLLLYENFPANGDWFDEVLALVLGPLRGRAPDLAAEADAYLACPMTQLGASRLPLATMADWLADPANYDAETSWNRALDSLAGPDPEVRRALQDQATEWGGWIGTSAYKPVWVENLYTVAESIGSEESSASFARVVESYPARMATLERVADDAFRDDLLEMMTRRLAIAQAIPLIREVRDREDAGGAEFDQSKAQLLAMVATQPTDSLRQVLGTLLTAAGVELSEPVAAGGADAPARP